MSIPKFIVTESPYENSLTMIHTGFPRFVCDLRAVKCDDGSIKIDTATKFHQIDDINDKDVTQIQKLKTAVIDMVKAFSDILEKDSKGEFGTTFHISNN
jgi:hypothetical protein